MIKITIIDYGSGNLFSIKNALEYLGYKAEITDSPKVIAKSKICILPGVGAFDASIKIIKKKKFLTRFVRYMIKKIKFLGFVWVCNYYVNRLLKMFFLKDLIL